MKAYVYYCDWDGKNGSHELLGKAVRQYWKDRQPEGRISELTVTQDGETGKPYFKEIPSIHFSISHSGKIWSCALSEREVGLDLQQMHERNCEKIARRFYHPMEIQWLERNGFDQFCRLWAYKESYVKYTGDGLIRGLDYFSVVSETPDVADVPGAEDVRQQEIPFRDGFWMVVTSADMVQVVLQELTGNL